MRLSNTSGPDGIRAFHTLSEQRSQWALDPSRFLGMQVLPFMPSLKILSTQLVVANAFLAIVSVLPLFFFISSLVAFCQIWVCQGGTQTLASSSP